MHFRTSIHPIRWFGENDLLLNADKSEVMMIGTPAQLRAASTVNTVAVADANLTLWSKLKSLGVILDSRLSFDAHVAMAVSYTHLTLPTNREV